MVYHAYAASYKNKYNGGLITGPGVRIHNGRQHTHLELALSFRAQVWVACGVHVHVSVAVAIIL